jgi:hypothetical protein
MNHSVTEVGSEHLAVLWSCHTEDDRRGRCVSAVEQATGELFQFALVVPTKLDGRWLAAFVPPTQVVSVVQSFYQYIVCHFSFVSIFEDRQQIVVVVLVVVVETSIAQVHAVVGIVLGGAPPIAAPDATILLLTLSTSNSRGLVCIPYRFT